MRSTGSTLSSPCYLPTLKPLHGCHALAGSAGAASAQPGNRSRAESVRTGAAPHAGRSSSSDDAARSSAGAPEPSNPTPRHNPAEGLPPLSPAEAGLVPGPPPSWVSKLAVQRQLVDLRCPRGAKTVLYAHAQLELFAWFGECARWDGMVQRATLYEVRCKGTVCRDGRGEWAAALLTLRVTAPGPEASACNSATCMLGEPHVHVMPACAGNQVHATCFACSAAH